MKKCIATLCLVAFVGFQSSALAYQVNEVYVQNPTTVKRTVVTEEYVQPVVQRETVVVKEKSSIAPIVAGTILVGGLITLAALSYNDCHGCGRYDYRVKKYYQPTPPRYNNRYGGYVNHGRYGGGAPRRR